MKRIIIVGGGLSGLTVAYALMKSPQLEVILLESDRRAGGKIWTDYAEGFLCEKGANGFLDNKPKTLDFCRELGIEPLRSNENAKKRYIFTGGRLNALPESPGSFIRSDILSWGGKLRLLYELIAPKGPDDETVAEFIKRRLGREALEKLIDPMVSGVFAGDPYKMSIKSCFPRIKELEQNYGSLIRAMIKLKKERSKEKGGKISAAPGGNLTSFYNGAQTITETIAGKLGERLKLEVVVHGIENIGDLYRVHTSNGVYESDAVVLASPAIVSAEILKDIDKDLSRSLLKIPYPPLSVVCFGYKKEKIGHPLNGFGFLIPHKEERRILGTLWDSSIFPNRAPEGYVLLRTMIGGAQSPELALLDDNKLVSAVFDELKPMLSIKTEPDMIRIYRWDKAIPQYVSGHGERLKTIDERLRSLPGLYLAGNSYRGVGMNDCIENGYRIAGTIMENFSVRI